MICPACRSENEMGYSVLGHTMVCLMPECGFELEMDQHDIEALLHLPLLPEAELVFA